MKDQNLVPLLKDIEIFQKFTEAELGDLAKSGEHQMTDAFSNLKIEGDMANAGLFIIIDGLIAVSKSDIRNGISYDLGELRKGNFFGEMSLLDNNPASATCRSLTPCELVFISKDKFKQFLAVGDRKLRFYERCVEALVLRLRQLDDNYIVSQYQLWKTALTSKSEVA